MSNRKSMAQVTLRCSVCGHLAFIWRRNCKLKEPNHVKRMYCPNCMEVRPFVETKEE